MKDVKISRESLDSVDPETIDISDDDVVSRPGESEEEFNARRAAKNKALKKTRRSDPLNQPDALDAIEYATRMADREWLLPIDTQAVLEKFQQLAKESLLLSAFICPPIELDAVADLSDPETSKSVVDLHDPREWGPDWEFVVDELNWIQRRIDLKERVKEQVDVIIGSNNDELGIVERTALVVNGLQQRIQELVEMFGPYGELKELLEAIAMRASSDRTRPGEGSGKTLDYAHVWAWFAANYLKNGDVNPFMSETNTFEPWDNASIVRLFQAISKSSQPNDPRLDDLADLTESRRLSNFLRQTKADNRLGNSRLNLDPSNISD